ncbi:ATP-dependent RNA helicase DQX1 isoform X2 [Sceloporus undulatus]|uniref:ATP-dependent RNA helicase DQX1 isoform X2 n=1 Tax=Sceloporus undulatus TaxID=8520 RepID=UPI001C4D9923|nr:ATP-dependent RNA helicase DQX1 isoform X2 [Sceloporus undulatus]
MAAQEARKGAGRAALGLGRKAEGRSLEGAGRQRAVICPAHGQVGVTWHGGAPDRKRRRHWPREEGAVSRGTRALSRRSGAPVVRGVCPLPAVRPRPGGLHAASQPGGPQPDPACGRRDGPQCGARGGLLCPLRRLLHLGDSPQEVSECCEAIRLEAATLDPGLGPLLVLPLHLGVGREVQRVYETSPEPPDGDRPRRIIVSHWMADAAFSVGSVRHVVDTGLELRSVYNPRIRAESQVLRPISKKQAESRRLRAAGSPPGSCLRLYSESFYEHQMPDAPPACITEANLSRLVLLLKRLDIADMGQCDFLDRPGPESLMQALEDLDYLAALDDDGNLSEVGIIMSEFPLDPQLAKALLASCEFDCVDEMLTLAAMLTAWPCFQTPPTRWEEAVAARQRGLLHPAGDHFTLINIFNAFHQQSDPESWCRKHGVSEGALRLAGAVRAELLEVMQRIELPVSPPAFGTDTNVLHLKQALLSGFFLKVARDIDGSGNYLLLTHKHVAQLPPSCCYQLRRPPPRPPPWLLYHEFTISQDNCLSVVSEIQPEMLAQLAPQYYLSNLPPSESRDLLLELREKLSGEEAAAGADPPRDEGPETLRCPLSEDREDVCVVQ